MIILLSPAKVIDVTRNGNIPFLSSPQYSEEASNIEAHITQYSTQELSDIFKINHLMASKVLKNAYDFDDSNTLSQASIIAYNGVAFKKLRADDFSIEDFEYAQQHLIIASSVYGLLKPLDKIKPYRMDFTSRIDGFGKSMRDYWKKTITPALLARLKEDDGILINLASDEIFKSFDIPLLKKSCKIINIKFIESKNQKYNTVHSTLAKQARGSMTRFIIKNRIHNIDQIKKYEELDMTFYSQLSNENEYTFLYR